MSLTKRSPNELNAGIDNKKDPKTAVNIFELLLLLIVKDFKLSAKEGAALLDNQSKYLAHVFTKGLKEDFKPIEVLLTDLSKLLPKIQQLCEQQDDEIFFMKSIKTALISKSEVVAVNCLSFISQYVEVQQDTKRKMQLIEEVITTLTLSSRRHPILLAPISRALLKLSDYDHNIVKLLLLASPQDVTTLFGGILCAADIEGRAQEIFRMDGVKNIVMATIQGLKENDNIANLSLLLQISQQSFEMIAEAKNAHLIGDYLQSMPPDGISAIYISICFSLISVYAKHKHPLAPVLFNILIKRYSLTEKREQQQLLLFNFRQIISQFPASPYDLIVEEISHQVYNKKCCLAEPQLQLLTQIASAAKMDAKVALMICNTLAKTVLESNIYVISVTEIFRTILIKFTRDDNLAAAIVKLVKQCLQIIMINYNKTNKKKKPLAKSRAEDSVQSSNVLLEYFLAKIVELQYQDINQRLQPLLCSSYLQLSRKQSDSAKGLQKILMKMGDIKQIVSRNEQKSKQENLLVAEEGSIRLAGHNRSKLKVISSNVKVVSSNVQAQKPVAEDMSVVVRMQQFISPKRHGSGQIGIDASRGLQKYQKIYLKKLDSMQQQRIRMQEEEEKADRLKRIYEKKMLEKGIEIRGKEDQIQCLFEFNSRDKEIEDKHQLRLFFFEAEEEEERDRQALEYFMRKYDKILRLIYSSYSGKRQASKCFDQLADNKQIIQTAGLNRMLKDYGLAQFINIKEIQTIVRHINNRLTKQRNFNDGDLDFQGFKQFLTHAALNMFSKPPKDMRSRPLIELLQQLLGYFELYASENKVNPALFEDPDAVFSNQAEAVRLMNRKLVDNPDYILPEGYKKIVDRKLTFAYAIESSSVSQAYRCVYQTLEEIILQQFQIHLIEPVAREEKIIKARPNLYFLERTKISSTLDKHIPVFLKKELVKYPVKERELAKQAATALADIIHAIELKHSEIGLKIENQAMRLRRQRDEEERAIKEEEGRRRQNYEKQLKNAVGQCKEKKESMKEKEAQARADKLAKQKEEKERRDKKDKELKLKIQQYNMKRKEQELKEKELEKMQQMKEKEQGQKRRQQTEEVKRKIEEAKKRKEEEELKRKAAQKEEEVKKKLADKNRFQEQQKIKKMKLEKYKEQKGGKGTEVASGPKTSPEGQRSTKQNGAFEIDDKQEGNHEIKGSARKEEAENEGQLYTILLPHKE